MTTENTDGVLGWDDTIENDGEFIVIPDGIYQFKVVKLERSRFAGSSKLPACPQANVTIEVFNDKGVGTTMEERLRLHSKMEWILCAFFRSIGLRKKDEPLQMKWDSIVGEGGYVEIGHRTFRGDNGDDITINQVNKWLPPEDAPTPATATFTPGEF